MNNNLWIKKEYIKLFLKILHTSHLMLYIKFEKHKSISYKINRNLS